MAKNCANIQNTGTEIARPISASLSQVTGRRSALTSAPRKPCTASTKHRVQLKMKPSDASSQLWT